MNIGITGWRGFIGSRVAATARERGHEVTGYSREARGGARVFSLEKPPDVNGLDAVVHLAGESIFGLWTAKKKERILRSRVEGTRRVVEAMAATANGPRTLVCSSAIGYYGDTGDTVADEETEAGEGFLAEVCAAWEAEARKAEKAGVRVVRVRTGFVIGRGGALKVIRPVFSLGLGGNLGNGKQWMSGIHVDDLAAIYVRAAEDAIWSGAINGVMPEPFRNKEFTQAVAGTLHRPAIFPAPGPLLRVAAGELSHLFLDSSRVKSRRLEEGFAFQHQNLKLALEEALGRSSD